MLREELLTELDIAFREAFPDRAQRLMREIERWCGEAADPETRDWRWFDAGDGAASAPGKAVLDRARVAAYRCSFCARSLLQANRMVGMRAGTSGEPHFTLEGYRHPIDRTPPGAKRPPMMCNFGLDAYHERLAEETLFGSRLPEPEMLISDAGRAMRARRLDRAESVLAELERRRALATPREIGSGVCELCKLDGERVVRGPVLAVCARCINRARYAVSNVVASSARR